MLCHKQEVHGQKESSTELLFQARSFYQVSTVGNPRTLDQTGTFETRYTHLFSLLRSKVLVHCP